MARFPCGQTFDCGIYVYDSTLYRIMINLLAYVEKLEGTTSRGSNCPLRATPQEMCSAQVPDSPLLLFFDIRL